MMFSKIRPSIFFVASLAIGTTQANVIDFEDLSIGARYSLLPTDYQGFTWGGGYGNDSWVLSSNNSSDFYVGYPQPLSHSGNNFAWNSGGVDLELTIHGGGTFDLLSFWTRDRDGSGQNATAHGYLNGNEVFSQSFLTNSGNISYAQITTNFVNIDRFILTSGYNIFVDDINVANISAVPVPAALWLFWSGLIGLLSMRKKVTS